MLFCHPFCSVVDVEFFCDGFCLRIDCVGGVCTGFLVGSCNAVPQEFVVLRLVKCVKVRSLVSGDEGFCRVIDFAYVFVEFVLEMDQVRFDYSTKNIPIPPKNSYLKSLIEKVESVIKRMRWKAFFFDRNEEDSSDVVTNNSFGFKSRKCPPQNNELDKFEADLLDMVHNVKFRNINNKF